MSQAPRITREDVLRVASLARLKLTEGELETYAGQLGRVLEYVTMLEQVDARGVEPLSHAAELANVLREDAPRDSLPRASAIANAPRTDGKFFLVPQVIESH